MWTWWRSYREEGKSQCSSHTAQDLRGAPVKTLDHVELETCDLSLPIGPLDGMSSMALIPHTASHPAQRASDGRMLTTVCTRASMGRSCHLQPKLFSGASNDPTGRSPAALVR